MVRQARVSAASLTLALAFCTPTVISGQTTPDVELSAPEVAAAANVPPFVWEMLCKPAQAGNRLNCLLSQTLIVPETGGRILRVDILPPDEKGGSDILRLLFPHGLRLDAVVALQVDAGPVFKVPLTRSAPEGVYAAHPIGRDVLSALMKGAVLHVSAVTEGRGLITLEVSLYGLSSAMSAVEIVQAAQNAAL